MRVRNRYAAAALAVAFAAMPLALAAQAGGSVTGTMSSSETHAALSGARASVQIPARASVAGANV